MQNRSRILAGIAVLSLVVAGCSKKEDEPQAGSTPATTTAAAPADRAADALAITQADSSWLRGVMGKHVDSVMAYYTPDVVSYSGGVAPAVGTDQVRAVYTEMVKTTFTNPSLTNTVKFSDDGSMAYDYGTYHLTMQPPGGKATPFDGAYVNVWKKVDGKWKIALESSTPIPAPK